MRGIIAFILLVFSLGIVLLTAPMVEDVADFSKDYVDNDNDDIIDGIVQGAVQYSILIGLAAGLFVSAAWYLRRERNVQQRRPPRR